MADKFLTTQSRILIWVGAFLRSIYWVSEYVFVMVAIHVIYAYWFEPSMLKLRIGLFMAVTVIPLVLVESLLTACGTGQ